MTRTQTTMISILMLIAVMTASPALAFVSTAPSLNATLLNYQPVPATAGSLLDVYIQVQNSGDIASNVVVTFIDNSPFRIDSENDRVKSIETLPGKQSFLLKYKVRVDKDALPGDNFLKLQWTFGSGTATQTALLPITVNGNAVSLTLSDVALSPELFVPGSTGNVRFTLMNDAQLKVSSGTIKLDLASLDLTPIGGTNVQRFTELQAGSSQSFSFNLAPGPSIAPGVYKIPVLISFTDQTGSQYNQSEYIGIRVGATPSVSVTLDDNKITKELRTGDFIIRVTNKGIGEVKFATVYLQPDQSYEIVSGSNERYVGNIDSDDYKTARIVIDAKTDEVKVPVKLTYLDALNKEYSVTETLTMKVRSSSTGGFSSGYIILILLVVGGAAWFFLRKRKK